MSIERVQFNSKPLTLGMRVRTKDSHGFKPIVMLKPVLRYELLGNKVEGKYETCQVKFSVSEILDVKPAEPGWNIDG